MTGPTWPAMPWRRDTTRCCAALQKLADRIQEEIGAFGYRAFTDSAPVLEKALARGAGLGWIGKQHQPHQQGCGVVVLPGRTLYRPAPAPGRSGQRNMPAHAGPAWTCAPPVLSWRLTNWMRGGCIAYLTIEHKGSIPEEFRAPMGNRIFGCDDWPAVLPLEQVRPGERRSGLHARAGLDGPKLTELFAWTEEEFLKRTEAAPSAVPAMKAGSGTSRWHWACAGHGHGGMALRSRESHPSELVREHVRWALAQHHAKGGGQA